MKHFPIIRCNATLLVILMMFLCRIGEAQTTWYTVELIVFQHLSNAGLYSEKWPLEPGNPTFEGAVKLIEEATESSETTDLFNAFQLLPRSEFQLTETVGHLKRSAAYRPLLHIAWRQPGFARSEALKVHIHSDITNLLKVTNEFEFNPSQAINGTIQLSRARYLHLDADLYHYREVPLDSPVQTTTFRIQDSRRMRSRELHYIDHPLVGLLVLATPYEPLKDEVETQELSQSQF